MLLKYCEKQHHTSLHSLVILKILKILAIVFEITLSERYNYKILLSVLQISSVIA